MKYVPKCNSDNGLGLALSALIGMTKATVENSAEYALTLIKEERYDEALVFLNNAIEGIEILKS